MSAGLPRAIEIAFGLSSPESGGKTGHDVGMTGRRIPIEIILHRIIHGRQDTVFSDPVKQPTTPKHLPHRILKLGKQDLGVGFFRLGDQAR